MRPRYFIILSIFILSCSDKTEEKELNKIVSLNSEKSYSEIDSTLITPEIKQEKEVLNYTDSNNLRQGKWIEKGYKDRVISIKHYKDDILNGYFFEFKGMERDGYYSNGKRNGFFRTYYDKIKDDKVMLLTLYENDSILWHTHPAADKDYLIPIKGIRVFKDSIYVSAPHTNGKTWYEGLFINGKYKGVHKIHSENGKPKATVDHDNKIITFFDTIDNRSISRISNDWRIKTNGNTVYSK